MFNGRLSNNIKTVIYKTLYYNCHYQHVGIFRNTSVNLFGMCNEVFSLNFVMDNPYTSLFLGNVQWKLVKQYQNSAF